MWAVNPPDAEVREVARLSARRVQDRAFAASIRASVPSLERNHERLREALSAGAIHAVDPSDFRVAELSDRQLHALYEQQLAHSKGAARSLYDAIIGGATFGLCSYCQHSQATTLDHFLPKSWVPGLSIEPWNLVPSCQQCNKKLLSFHALTEEECLFHPYEEWVDERWLFAEVVEVEPTTVKFAARPSGALDQLTRDRVSSQFVTLGLAMMYTAVSNRDISEARASIDRSTRAARGTSGDPDLTLEQATIAELLGGVAAEAFAVDPNSRKGAVYEALAASEWFITSHVVVD